MSKAASYINAVQYVHALMCEREHTVPHVQKIAFLCSQAHTYAPLHPRT